MTDQRLDPAGLEAAAMDLIEAYDGWSVNNYPTDGGSSTHAQAWFQEAQQVENAVEKLRAAYLSVQEQPQRAEDVLPADLLAVLRDPSIIVSQDQKVFDLIAKWQNAPTPTMGGGPPVQEQPPKDSIAQELDERMALIERFALVFADPECQGDCDGTGIDLEGGEWTLCECALNRLLTAERSPVQEQSPRLDRISFESGYVTAMSGVWSGFYPANESALALFMKKAWKETGADAKAQEQPDERESLTDEERETDGERLRAELRECREAHAQRNAALLPDSISPVIAKRHYLAEVVCDHEAGRDKPRCACSRVDLGWHPSVGEAVDAWIAHAVDETRASLVGRHTERQPKRPGEREAALEDLVRRASAFVNAVAVVAEDKNPSLAWIADAAIVVHEGSNPNV